ncbi:MAG: hypothetical protein HYR72_26995 [Deltaproteobacteria bacterium]|nr:hypothetical protein [Deltaproteobacteria bacterium]MBI3390338.1 hypothetical protein [Deltaproteobacteria bacterium]
MKHRYFTRTDIRESTDDGDQRINAEVAEGADWTHELVRQSEIDDESIAPAGFLPRVREEIFPLVDDRLGEVCRDLLGYRHGLRLATGELDGNRLGRADYLEADWRGTGTE